jgi:hypothetical protein
MKQETLTCLEVQRFLHPYMDGEFDDREELELEQHLHHCSQCQQELRFHQSLKRQMREQHQNGLAPVHLQALISSELRQASRPPRQSWVSTLSAAAMFCIIVGGIGKGVFDRSGASTQASDSTRVQKVLEGNTATGMVRFLDNNRFLNMTSKLNNAAPSAFSSKTMPMRAGFPLKRTSFSPVNSMIPSFQRASELLQDPKPMNATSPVTVPGVTSVQFCSDAVMTGVSAASSSTRSLVPAVFNATCDENN